MSEISCLPDELVKKIFGLLLDCDTYRQSDYMSLALTCKRFYDIGVKQFEAIKRLDPKTNELFALNTFLVHKNSYHQKKYPQMYKIYCKAHSDGWYDECFERGLSVVLANRTSDVKGLRIVGYDLEKHKCLESIESYRLDKIVELTLVSCDMTYNDFYRMIGQFKNLASLHLYRTHLSSHRRVQVHPKIDLQYFYSAWEGIFEEPQVQISAKVVVIGNLFRTWSCPPLHDFSISYSSAIMMYLIRNKHKIELVRLVRHSSRIWTWLMQRCGLEHMKWEIIHDTDVNDICHCHKWVSTSPYPSLKRIDFIPMPEKPCIECLNGGGIQRRSQEKYEEALNLFKARISRDIDSFVRGDLRGIAWRKFW